MTPDNKDMPRPCLNSKGGTTHPLITLPNLDNDKFKANAKANSFPLNHLVTIADYVTDRDSPPKPNIALPNIITQ